MRLRTAVVALALMCVGAATVCGCGDGCADDDYAQAARAKLEECGIEPGDEPDDPNPDGCSDTVSTLAECLTPCIENVPCSALDGDDPGAIAFYSACVGACA